MASSNIKTPGTVLDLEGKHATKVVPGAAVKAKYSMTEPPTDWSLKLVFKSVSYFIVYISQKKKKKGARRASKQSIFSV